MKHRALWPLCAGLLLEAALSGCGPGNPLGRQAVSGSVTLDSEPLDRGSIEFSPKQQRGGVGSGALITGGRYAIPAERGLPPGKYVVRLFSAEKSDRPAPEGPPGPDDTSGQGKQRVPPRYNVQSDTIVEVTADGPNKFDFDIRTR